MPDLPVDHFNQDRLRADLSHGGKLWLRYFELGGMSTAMKLEAYLFGALVASEHDNDVIDHTLYERFVEARPRRPTADIALDDTVVDQRRLASGAGMQPGRLSLPVASALHH